MGNTKKNEIISYDDILEKNYVNRINPLDTNKTGYIDEDYENQINIYVINYKDSLEYLDEIADKEEEIDYEDY